MTEVAQLEMDRPKSLAPILPSLALLGSLLLGVAGTFEDWPLYYRGGAMVVIAVCVGWWTYSTSLPDLKTPTKKLPIEHAKARIKRRAEVFACGAMVGTVLTILASAYNIDSSLNKLEPSARGQTPAPKMAVTTSLPAAASATTAQKPSPPSRDDLIFSRLKALEEKIQSLADRSPPFSMKDLLTVVIALVSLSSSCAAAGYKFALANDELCKATEAKTTSIASLPLAKLGHSPETPSHVTVHEGATKPMTLEVFLQNSPAAQCAIRLAIPIGVALAGLLIATALAPLAQRR